MLENQPQPVEPGAMSFIQYGSGNPCHGCPAPCCRMQLIPYKTPEGFMDIDHARYLLLFPATEMVVTNKGEWYVLKWSTCREFDESSCACGIHGTNEQPRICFAYNAYNCWYKRNFVTDQPPELYRLDLARFDVWVNEILFDDAGKIARAPNFEAAQALLRDLPLSPTFRTAATISLNDLTVNGAD